MWWLAMRVVPNLPMGKCIFVNVLNVPTDIKSRFELFKTGLLVLYRFVFSIIILYRDAVLTYLCRLKKKIQ